MLRIETGDMLAEPASSFDNRQVRPSTDIAIVPKATMSWPPPLPPSPEVLGMRALFLFMPFYTPPDPDRYAELLYCLDQNLQSGLFARIVLMVDDDTEPPRNDPRLTILRLNHRPSYLDWVRAAREICPGHVAVLMNSDIYAHASLSRLLSIFEADNQAFIALSRFEKIGDDLKPHPSPHWSQDCWAFMPGSAESEPHDDGLNIPLGVPRCDNKIAYRFSIQGYTVFNPFPYVKIVHVHETGRRYYSKTGDERVIGTVAYVHPGNGLKVPAKLDLDVWTVRTSQIKSLKVNVMLERWREEARLAKLPHPTWVAHDADWQYPAITEQHAFERIRAFLPQTRPGKSAVYLGFPFATLIDMIVSFGPNHAKSTHLRDKLASLTEQVRGYDRVISVAQHIRGREFAKLFAEAGVTDLFWSHAVIGEDKFADTPQLRVHPFPLYPVQQVLRDENDMSRPRRWLYSFVGARSHPKYLTQVRTMIIEQLSADPRACVISRDQWHYQKVVYDGQIRSKSDVPTTQLINADHSNEFRDILDESTFSLCPSGSGPNSIRLWESMVNGSIPVILADTWAAPGMNNPAVAALWAEGTLRVPETAYAVAALPAQMEAIAADPALLRRKRLALAELARRYGPEKFVADMADMFEIA